MSKRETYETRTEELITPILDRMNFELVDVVDDFLGKGDGCT